MWGLYNLVIAIFVITIILVAYSASVIYEAFAGSEHIEEEIMAFVNYAMINTNVQISVFNSFCDQWLRVSTSQENSEYELYLKTFNKGLGELIRADSTRTILLERCVNLSKMLLTIGA